METTANLALPYIMPSQAQKHVTHNEALDVLDSLIQLAVIDRHLPAPPGLPAQGDRHIVGAGASGDWAGREDSIAIWLDGGWMFRQPRPGWLAFVLDDSTLVRFDGTAWTGFSSASVLQGLTRLGLGTDADALNPFSARLNNMLLTARGVADGGDGDLRCKLNKETAGGTVSQLYQTGFSGRAETGLAGNDDFTIKVSADGAAWRDALVVAHDSGKVAFPQTNVLTDFAVNLFQDAGRFAGNAAFAAIIGAFAFPAYLSLYNASSVLGHGKFITNNTDYGGTGGALNGDVKALVDTIRDTAFRRYGLEFWVARVTHGAGVATPLSHLGQTYYLGLLANQGARPPSMTFHAYLRALDGDILVRHNPGQTILANGAASTGNVVIAPADGWVSITIRDAVDPRFSNGYNPSILMVYAKVAGHRWLLACPALMGGLTTVNDDAGLIAGFNGWAG